MDATCRDGGAGAGRESTVVARAAGFAPSEGRGEGNGGGRRLRQGTVARIEDVRAQSTIASILVVTRMMWKIQDATSGSQLIQ